ncbi:MAG: hypothetical protein HYZ31_05280 [Gammaproteobacteria bacterium]|nr:hypothetical protein [Gammaproteobacteria bacterium]
MAVYEITPSMLRQLPETSFASEGIKERDDLQRLIIQQIDVLSPNTLVIAEEFGEWEDSRRRIDILGISNDANLVVIELKRTEDGGHMDLQAIRYAAMVSTLTFDKVVEIYGRFLEKHGKDDDPETAILAFLDWDEPQEDEFAQDVNIILASKEFSKELTTAVIWLNERDLNIRCIRMKPYKDKDKVLLDVQTVIPLPEAEDYQVQIREKQVKERQSRLSSRDFTRYTLIINGNNYPNLPKRGLMFHVVKSLVDAGIHPADLMSDISWRRNNLFVVFDGELDESEVYERLMEKDIGGAVPKYKRYFSKADELMIVDGKTYVLSNQWGNRTLEAVELLKNKYDQLHINVQPEY